MWAWKGDIFMNPRLKLAGVFAILLAATLNAGQAPPTQRPLFRTQVEYVEVDAVVTDAAGNFVPDLKKDDFIVREDGKNQSITAFSMVSVPTVREQGRYFARQPIVPDVKSNDRPFDGRIYVMLLDDLHVDAARTQRARDVARAFIEKNMAANDLMAVMTVGGGQSATQEFTNNKQLLAEAVDNFTGSKLPSITQARNEEYYIQLAVENRTTLQRDSSIGDPYELTRVFNARASLRTIRDVADWFGGVRGRRKSVILVSEGLDVEVNQVLPLGASGNGAQIQSDNQGGSMVITDLLETIGAAQRSNVTLYTVDPRGLTNLADDSISVSSFASQNEALLNNGTPANTMAKAIGATSIREELMRSQDDLRTLAEETGGLAATGSNDFDQAFQRIVNDSTAYYVLAYYPPSDKRDGKFHKIDVQVKRPGLRVRSRNGYRSKVGPAPDPEMPGGRPTSPELRDTLSSPLPISGLTMHVFAAPFRGTTDKNSVLLGVDAVGSDINLSDKNSLELSYIAMDGKRTMVAGHNDRLNLNLRADTKTRAQQTGIRILNRLDLDPGRYQLRVASRDSMGGAVGSVTWDLEVPDFGKDPLAMSGVVLTSVTSSTWPTGKADAQMRQVLPAQPTALREFPRDDELALFAEVYDNRVATPHQVEITSTVLTPEGRVLFKTQEDRSSVELAGASRGAYGYSARIPLRDVPPGDYVLSVRARSTLNSDIERRLAFTVEDQNAAAARSAAAASSILRTVERGEMSFTDTPRQFTARTEAEWSAIWKQHAANRPEPTVDFSREMVVGVFLGTRPTGGHSVEIVGTREDQNALVVQYREHRPERGAITTQIVTSPYHMVVVAQRPGAVKFEKVD
jgi:VWFA-related protein